MRRPLIVSALLSAAILAGGALWYFNPTGERAFILACEETLKDRLTSPATYKRVSSSPQSRSPATLNEYLGVEFDDKRRWQLAANASDAALRDSYAYKSSGFRMGDYDRLEYRLEYDTENAYGTPIRGYASCSQIVKAGQPVGLERYETATVDGFNKFDWAFFSLWKLRQ